MQKELFNQAAKLFDSLEKWDAYLELVSQEQAIRIHYLKKIKKPLLEYFINNPAEGWVCQPWSDDNYDMRWYLKDFGKDSLAIATGWLFKFCLHVEDINKFDSLRIDNLLQSEYSFFLSKFEQIENLYTPNFKVIESRNYVFNTPYDHDFDENHLAWFAGNRTQELVNQIIAKVERFTKDEEMTRMLREVNEKAKKQ